MLFYFKLKKYLESNMDVTDINIDDFLEKDERVALSKERAAEADAFLKSCGKKPLEVFFP